MQKDDLLADLELSIKKALDARTVELTGALFRLQGSANGWCNLPDCGNCALAPHKCITDLEKTVEQRIEEHHAQDQATNYIHTNSATIEGRHLNGHRLSPVFLTNAKATLMASRLYRQLGNGAIDFVAEKIRSISPTKSPNGIKRWKRIEAAMHAVAIKKNTRADHPVTSQPELTGKSQPE